MSVHPIRHDRAKEHHAFATPKRAAPPPTGCADEYGTSPFRLGFDKETKRWRYHPDPDSTVFDWDEATVKAVENSVQVIEGDEVLPTPPHHLKRHDRKEYDEDVATKLTLLKFRLIADQLEANGSLTEASMLRDCGIRDVRSVVHMRRRYVGRANRLLLGLFVCILLISMLGPAKSHG